MSPSLKRSTSFKPESSYGRQQDLSNEQIEEFTKQYQEASLDDKNWLAKRLVADTAVKDAIEESRAAVRKEEEERKEKSTESQGRTGKHWRTHESEPRSIS